MSKKIIVLTGSINDRESFNSASSKAALLFIDKYKELNGDADVKHIDLNTWDKTSTPLTSKTFDEFFKNSKEVIDMLKEADGIVISTSMTNFGYTSAVKNFIDKICLAGESFKYKYDGSGLSEGLIKTNVQIITAQGAPKGWYPFGDHTLQLGGTFKFLGMNVLAPIIIAGTKTPENAGKTSDDFVNEITADIERAAKEI